MPSSGYERIISVSLVPIPSTIRHRTDRIGCVWKKKAA